MFVTEDEFKELRNKAGHTQATLAKEMGVHLRTVTRWEIGEVIIPKSCEWPFDTSRSKRRKNGGGKTWRRQTESMNVRVGTAMLPITFAIKWTVWR